MLNLFKLNKFKDNWIKELKVIKMKIKKFEIIFPLLSFIFLINGCSWDGPSQKSGQATPLKI